MDGYEVDVEALRKAAKAATSAGEQAGRVKLGEAVVPVAEAMPGSASAGRAPALASAWGQRLTGWSTDVTAFGDDLAASADGYEKNEDAAASDFGLLGGLFGGSGG